MTPKGWISARLDELLISDSPGFWGEAPDGVNEIAVLRATNLRKYGIGLDFSDLAYRSFPERKLNEKRLRPGDILLERSGGGPQQPVGRVALFEHDGTYSYSNFMQRLRVDANKCIDKYVVYRLSYLHSQGETARLQQATTGIRNLQYKDYLALVHPIPPLPEQRKIAAILSAVDAVIERTQAVIDQLQQVKKALMQELLTRGIPGRHTRFKQTEIGEVPEGWEVVRLGNLATFVTSGSRGWAPYYSDRGALFLRITNLSRGTTRLDLADRQHVCLPADSAEGTRTRVEPGDILISITADLGLIGLIPDGFEEAYVNQHIALVRLAADKAHSAYIASALAGAVGDTQVRRLNDGGAKAGLNLASIRQLLVPFPPLEEQRLLVTPIEETENRIAEEQAALQQLRVVKSALSSALLTGEIRVQPDEATP